MIDFMSMSATPYAYTAVVIANQDSASVQRLADRVQSRQRRAGCPVAVCVEPCHVSVVGAVGVVPCLGFGLGVEVAAVLGVARVGGASPAGSPSGTGPAAGTAAGASGAGGAKSPGPQPARIARSVSISAGSAASCQWSLIWTHADTYQQAAAGSGGIHSAGSYAPFERLDRAVTATRWSA